MCEGRECSPRSGEGKLFDDALLRGAANLTEISGIVGEKQEAVLNAIRDYNETVDAANKLEPCDPPRVRFIIQLDRYCEGCGQRY